MYCMYCMPAVEAGNCSPICGELWDRSGVLWCPTNWHWWSSLFAGLKLKKERQRTKKAQHLRFICSTRDLISPFRYGQEMQHRGLQAGKRRWLKLWALNQNPPPAALKLSPSNTRGFPVKRKGCPSGRTAGRGQLQELYRIRAIWTWFWLKRTLTHTGTQAEELAPHVNHLTCLKLTQF